MPDFNKKKGDISILYKIIMSFFLKKEINVIYCHNLWYYFFRQKYLLLHNNN